MTDGTAKFDPIVLPGGDVVYTVLETPVQTRLVRLRPSDPTPTKLHPDATTSEFEATFTADGAAYAFVQSRGNLNLKLVIREPAAGREAVFDPGGGFAGVRRPTFHPRGERVCFAIPAPTGQEIASGGRDGKDRRTLTAGGINNWPAYSPDGSRVAFCSSRDGTFDLYVMNADGSGVRRVVELDGMQARPAWSPDGRRLAFTWNRGGVYEVHAVNLDGTGRVRLAGGPERSDYPVWHPDGGSVVFVGERAGRFDLYRVRAG
jgi:WD40 repeat protein